MGPIASGVDNLTKTTGDTIFLTQQCVDALANVRPDDWRTRLDAVQPIRGQRRVQREAADAGRGLERDLQTRVLMPTAVMRRNRIFHCSH